MFGTPGRNAVFGGFGRAEVRPLAGRSLKDSPKRFAASWKGVPRTSPRNRDFLGPCVLPGKPGRRPSLRRRPPHASSNAVGCPKMAHCEGSPGRGLQPSDSLPRRMLSPGPTWLVVRGSPESLAKAFRGVSPLCLMVKLLDLPRRVLQLIRAAPRAEGTLSAPVSLQGTECCSSFAQRQGSKVQA